MKVLTLVLVLCLLSSCEKLIGQKDTQPTAIQQVPDPVPVAVPPPPPPEPVPVPEPVALPEITFGYDEWVYQGANRVHLEVNLSKASLEPVMVDIFLVDGTALYPNDYVGFSGSSANDLKIAVEFTPGVTHIDVPALFIPDGATCDTEFTATLNKDTVQKAVVAKETALIKLPCL